MGNILKFWAGICLSLLATNSFAESMVQNTLLSNGECAMHYLTHRDITGWKLANLDGHCANGKISGAASVRILNAFGKTVSVLNGVFNQGYYIEKTENPLHLSTFFEGDSQQILSFELEPDSELSLSYMGYLVSEQLSDGDYGRFLACQPTRLMAITPNIELFEDEVFQQALINSAIARAKSVCPDTPHVYLYGSDQEKPDNRLISFFADIDLEARQIKVKRLPQSSRVRNVWSSPEETLPLPKEIRHESGIKIVQITPVIEDIPSNTIPDIQQNPIQKSERSSLPKTPVASDPTLDAIPNLLTAARLLKQPVSGKAMVHIASFDEEGTALIDRPMRLKAKGLGLSIGWGIAQGDFTYISGASDTPQGFIQVSQFVPKDRP